MTFPGGISPAGLRGAKVTGVLIFLAFSMLHVPPPPPPPPPRGGGGPRRRLGAVLPLKGSGPGLPDCVASVAHDSGQSCPVRFLTWKWAQNGRNVLGLPEGPRGRMAQAQAARRHLFLSLSLPRVLQLPVLGSKRKRGSQVKAEAGPEALRFSTKNTGMTTPDEAASVRTFAFRQRPQAAPAGPRPALGRAEPRLLPAGCWSTARLRGPYGGGARGRGRGPPPRMLAPPGRARRQRLEPGAAGPLRISGVLVPCRVASAWNRGAASFPRTECVRGPGSPRGGQHPGRHAGAPSQSHAGVTRGPPRR